MAPPIEYNVQYLNGLGQVSAKERGTVNNEAVLETANNGIKIEGKLYGGYITITEQSNILTGQRRYIPVRATVEFTLPGKKLTVKGV